MEQTRKRLRALMTCWEVAKTWERGATGREFCWRVLTVKALKGAKPKETSGTRTERSDFEDLTAG